jgi:Tol biopolymer transport system component
MRFRDSRPSPRRTRHGSGASLIVAVALVAALACGCAGGRDATGDAVDHGGSLVSEEGQIAFTHAPKANWADLPSSDADVYVMDVDGSGQRRLTDSPGLDGFPAWSPDGERIAFVSARDGDNCEIYVMDADGSGQERLTHTPDDEYFLAWSPDGERIAYSTNPAYAPMIWVMDADGSDRKQLEIGLFPSWSPDSERIAYTAYSGGQPYIAVMNADGSGRRRLGGASAEEEPVWSPDGKKIAFASMEDGEIYAMNVDGSGRTRLTDIPKRYDHWPPTWSPDGNRIAFTSEDKKGSEIYAMNSDGSGLTKLTDDPAEDFYPAWRP